MVSNKSPVNHRMKSAPIDVFFNELKNNLTRFKITEQIERLNHWHNNDFSDSQCTHYTPAERRKLRYKTKQLIKQLKVQAQGNKVASE